MLLWSTARTFAVALLIAGGSLGVGVGADARETLELETQGVPGAYVAGPVVTAVPLADGARYFVRVSGTSSIHRASDWQVTSRQPCGLPESGPQYPTPGSPNGVVGFDAETVFALPAYAYFHGYVCKPGEFPFRISRHSDGGVQFSQGDAFSRAVPIGGPRDVPRADHTYTYEFRGNNEKLWVRWIDSPLPDNYGRYRIEVLTEAECAAEQCAASAQPTRDNVVSTGTVIRPLVQAAVDTRRAARRCASRRSFTVRVRKYRGVTIGSATITVRGRRYVMVRKGQRLRGQVVLRGLVFGTFKVRIDAITTRGQRLVDVRTFRTCRVKRAR